MLEHAFNRMVERLERKRRKAGAYALRVQEDERKRLAVSGVEYAVQGSWSLSFELEGTSQ